MGVSLSAGKCHGDQSLTYLFFSLDPLDKARAKHICSGCSIQVRCRTVAQDNNEIHGIWGGWDEEDRQRARRRNLNSVLEDLLSTVLPHNTQHEQAHPENGFLFSPSHISFLPNQTPSVSPGILAFLPSFYAFDIAS